MANTQFVNAQAEGEFRKSTGAGTDLDPKIFDAHLDKADGTRIDPATEQKQDALIGHVDGIEALLGSGTETAPDSDTASSGLNGRLQRIAQRLTSLIALFPASLGQKDQANSFSVVLASDSDALPLVFSTTDRGTATAVTGTTSAVAGTWTDFAAANANRLAWGINPGSSTIDVGVGAVGAEVYLFSIRATDPPAFFEQGFLGVEKGRIAVRSASASVAYTGHQYVSA